MHQSSTFARLVGAVVGFTLIGLGIAFYVKADIGSDPFTVLVLGISGKTGISVGRANQLNSVFLLVVLLILDRSRIGFGTLLNAFIVGWALDFLPLVPDPVTPFDLLANAGCRGFSCMDWGWDIRSADFGQGSIEGVMVMISDKRQVSISSTRIGMDVTAVVIGLLLGASFDPVVVGAVLTGPVAYLTVTVLARLFNSLASQGTSKYEFISFRSFSDCLGWPVIATRVSPGHWPTGRFCQGDLLGEPSPSATPATSRHVTFWNRRLFV